ncbi:MAG: hypothetical protein NVS9B9_29960 [Ktedonobacteraceae bacterium]
MPQYTLKAPEAAREWEVIPANTELEAEILGIEERTKPFKDDNGKDVVKVNFSFKVTSDGEYKNRRQFGETSTSFVDHPDCKFRAWVKAALGVDSLPQEFVLDTDDLLGLPVRLIIGNKPKKNADGTTGTRDYVQDVLPIRHSGDVGSADEYF